MAVDIPKHKKYVIIFRWRRYYSHNQIQYLSNNTFDHLNLNHLKKWRLDLTYLIVYKQRDWIQVIATLENPLSKTYTNSTIVQRNDWDGLLLKIQKVNQIVWKVCYRNALLSIYLCICFVFFLTA